MILGSNLGGRPNSMEKRSRLASKNPLTIRRNARRLAAIIREHKVDIVHARSRAPI